EFNSSRESVFLGFVAGRTALWISSRVGRQEDHARACRRVRSGYDAAQLPIGADDRDALQFRAADVANDRRRRRRRRRRYRLDWEDPVKIELGNRILAADY